MPGRGIAGAELAERIVTTAQAMGAADQRSTAHQACCLVEWQEDTRGWLEKYIDDDEYDCARANAPPRSTRAMCITKINDSAAVFIPTHQPPRPKAAREEYMFGQYYDDEEEAEQPPLPAPTAVVRAAVAVTPATIKLMAAKLAKQTFLPDPDCGDGEGDASTRRNRPGTLYLSTPLPWEGSSPAISTDLYCNSVDWRMHEAYVTANDEQQDTIQEALEMMVELVKAVVPGLQL